MSTQRRPSTRGRRGRAGARPGRQVVTAAPIGGIKKNNGRPARGGIKSVPTGPSGGHGDSKIVVSNLVRKSENLVKIFTKTFANNPNSPKT